MRQSLAVLSALTGLAFAQNSTLEFFFPGGYDGVDPVASVLTANPSTTVLDIACPTGADSNDCGWGPGVTYSIISTTIYQASMVEPDEFTMTWKCEHNTKAEEMSCGVSMRGSGANDPGTTDAVLTGTDITYVTATVVEGEELLSATGSAGSAVASSVVSETAKETGSVTKVTGTVAQSSGSSATVSGSGAPAENTGAAGRFVVEGGVALAVAGAAVLGAW